MSLHALTRIRRHRRRHLSLLLCTSFAFTSPLYVCIYIYDMRFPYVSSACTPIYVQLHATIDYACTLSPFIQLPSFNSLYPLATNTSNASTIHASTLALSLVSEYIPVAGRAQVMYVCMCVPRIRELCAHVGRWTGRYICVVRRLEGSLCGELRGGWRIGGIYVCV